MNVAPEVEVRVVGDQNGASSCEKLRHFHNIYVVDNFELKLENT